MIGAATGTDLMPRVYRPVVRTSVLGRGVALVAASLLVLSMLPGCATIGSGRAEVVRAEDVLVNSLTVYDATMALHYQISAQEPKDVYDALERARKTFPAAWRTARTAVRGYKAGRAGDLPAAMEALETALDELRDLLAQLRAVRPAKVAYALPWDPTTITLTHDNLIPRYDVRADGSLAWRTD